jgi:hypothetical protein
MMGSTNRKMNIKHKPMDKAKKISKLSPPAHDYKTLVTIDGFEIARGKRVNICATCAKVGCCSLDHRANLCTSAGFWYDTKKKYRWKIMGRYRLTLWVREQDKKIRRIDWE